MKKSGRIHTHGGMPPSSSGVGTAGTGVIVGGAGGSGVGVAVCSGTGVAVGCGLGVAAGSGVAVGVAVGRGVAVCSGTGVAVGGVGVGVAVGSGVTAGVASGAGVGVSGAPTRRLVSPPIWTSVLCWSSTMPEKLNSAATAGACTVYVNCSSPAA